MADASGPAPGRDAAVGGPTRRVAVTMMAWATVCIGGLLPPTVRAADTVLPEVTVLNPPAFGFQIGDVVQRQLRLRLPPGARFDPGSLPPPTRQGAALELASVRHDDPADAAEQSVVLNYQVFRSPPAPAVLEIPPLLLRFSVASTGSSTGRREMTVRVEAHPLMVSPLAPADPPNRSGLGPMQPDLPAPDIPLDSVRTRLSAWLVLAGIGAAWLVWRHGLQPAWRRQQRPFARAWRDLRQLLPGSARDVDEATLKAATRRLHAALRADAGRVLLAADVPDWLAARPRFAALQAPLMAFHQRSSQRFFAPIVEQETAGTLDGQPGQAEAARARAQEAAALRALSRALAQAEAGP